MIIPIAAGAVLILAALTAVFWISCRRVPGPNEALLVTGGRGQGGQDFRIVVGRPTTVIPGIQTVRNLRLNLHEIPLVLQGATTSQGIPVGIRAAAAFRIATDGDSIANAARQFVGQEQLMDSQVNEILLGHLRDYVGNLKMEQLITGKEELAAQVRETSAAEMEAMGLALQTMKVQEIMDPERYIEKLAAPHIAEAEKNARIARSENDRQAAEAEQTNAQQVAAAKRDTEIKQAQYDAQIQAEQATAAQSGPLAQARAEADVVKQQTAIAELRATQRERELDSQVRKPAEAQRDAEISQAQAARQSAILAAEANAESTKLSAAAQAEQTTLLSGAEASRIASVGKAEAEATRAKGEAEGAALHARAEALKENEQAVIGQQVAGQLPEIVRALASTFDHVDHMTVLNGADGVMNAINTVLTQAVTSVSTIRGALDHKNSSNGKVEPELVGLTH